MKKMIMVVIPHEEADRVIDQLVLAGYTATFMESRGGVLFQAQQTLFIAVDAENLPEVLAIIRDNCHTRVQVKVDAKRKTAPAALAESATAELGGAVVMVWDLTQFERF